jgi:hypothetical protein
LKSLEAVEGFGDSREFRRRSKALEEALEEGITGMF